MTPEATALTPQRRRRPGRGWWCAAVLALAGCATTPQDVHQQAAAGDDQAVDKVAKALNSSNAAVRQAAIVELLKMKHSGLATDALLSATLSPNPAVRGAVGAALLFNANADMEFYAITLVADKDPAVRVQMAEGLAVAGRAGPYEKTREAGIYLWGLEQDENQAVRAAAAKGLGELGLQDPIKFALEALRTDPEPQVRAAAAQGLGTPARAYLSGERGPGWGDAKVEQYLTKQLGANPATPVQISGAEIVDALCRTAETDAGHYMEVVYVDTWFDRTASEHKRWVAVAAADALTVPGRAPTAKIAQAQAAANARAQTPDAESRPTAWKSFPPIHQ